jgi:hypothetical protein
MGAGFGKYLNRVFNCVCACKTMGYMKGGNARFRAVTVSFLSSDKA